MAFSERSRERDKALIIALNFSSEPEGSPIKPLKTPIRDAEDFASLLQEKGYLKRNITVMTDEMEDPAMTPTRENIFRELENFTRDVQKGDRRVFSFGGHGFQITSNTPEEEDGMDEVVLVHGHHGPPNNAQGEPLDPGKMSSHDPDREKLNGIITDNEFHEWLVKKLAPTGCRLIAIFDTCHSGTMLDLDYHWKYENSQYVTVPSPLCAARKDPGMKLATSPQLRKKSLPKPKRSQDAYFLPPTDDEMMRLTMSPEQRDGLTLADESERSDIYSIASSLDNQSAWEMDVTMLSTLVQILRDNRDVSLTIRELMVELQNRLYIFRKNAFLSSASGARQNRKQSWLQRTCNALKAAQLPQFGSQSRSAPHKKFSL